MDTEKRAEIRLECLKIALQVDDQNMEKLLINAQKLIDLVFDWK